MKIASLKNQIVPAGLLVLTLSCGNVFANNINETSGAGGSDWNTTSAWTGGGALSGANNYITTTASGSGAGTLWGVSGFTGRIRVNGASTFGGGSLTVSAGTEVLLKGQTANASVAESANWIMNGGVVRWGGNGVSPNPSTNQLQGTMNVMANSYLMAGTLSNSASVYGQEVFNISSSLTGSGNLTLISGNQTPAYVTLANASATGLTFLFTGDLSAYDGTLILGNGLLTGEKIELNPSSTSMSGTTLDLASSDATTMLQVDSALTLDSLVIGANTVGPGTYTASQLNALGDGGSFAGTGSVTIVPEPSTMALIGSGVFGLFAMMKRRK